MSEPAGQRESGTGAHTHEGAHCVHALELETRARLYLAGLGFGHHHEAATDPVYALFQVAADGIARANGYRDLYERLRDGR